MPSRLSQYTKQLGFSDGWKLYRYVKSGKDNAVKLSFLQHPVFLRDIYSDRTMFEQIFLNKEYDVHVNFSPISIIDLGANVGYASVYFANRFPNAKIFAVEPEENNYQIALKNTKPYPNITLVKGAVWHKPEQINVVDNGFGEAGFMIQSGEGTNTVRAYTIKEIMGLMGIDEIGILKIDIEGAEKEIFETGSEEWIPKTKMMIAETHDRYKKGTSKAVFNAIGKYDFSLELSGENLVLYNNDLIKETIA
jgi:FkbM family methyltransferase